MLKGKSITERLIFISDFIGLYKAFRNNVTAASIRFIRTICHTEGDGPCFRDKKSPRIYTGSLLENMNFRSCLIFQKRIGNNPIKFPDVYALLQIDLDVSRAGP